MFAVTELDNVPGATRSSIATLQHAHNSRGASLDRPKTPPDGHSKCYRRGELLLRQRGRAKARQQSSVLEVHKRGEGTAASLRGRTNKGRCIPWCEGSSGAQALSPAPLRQKSAYRMPAQAVSDKHMHNCVKGACQVRSRM